MPKSQNVEFRKFEPSQPQQPPAAKPASPPPAPAPTAAELQEKAKNAMGTMFGSAAAPVTAPAAPVVAPAPAPAPVVAPVAPAPAPADPLAIARETGTAIARELNRERPVPPPAAPVVVRPTFEMTPEDAEAYDIAVWLSANRADKHAGLDVKFVEWLKKAYAYIEEWQAKNPDAEWDPNAEVHNPFFAANPTPMDAKTIDQAKIDMLVEKRVAERMKPVEAKITMMDNAATLENAAGTIAANVNEAIILLVDEAAPELGALLVNAQGVRTLSDATAEKMRQTDPVAYRILNAFANDLTRVGWSFEQALLLDQPLPQQLEEFRTKHEAALAVAPAEAQMFNDGRRFKSARELADLKRGCRGDRARLQALEQEYRSFTARELTELMAVEYAATARREINEVDGVAREKYAKTVGAAAATAQNQPHQPPTPPPNVVHIPSNRPPPSSLSSGSETVNTPNPAGQGAQTPAGAMVHHMFK